LSGVFPNKMVLFAYVQTFWHPQNFWAGYATRENDVFGIYYHTTTKCYLRKLFA